MRRLGLIAALAGVCALTVAAAPAAGGAGAKPVRYIGLVLSDHHYVVYLKSDQVATGGRSPVVINRRGTRRALTGVPPHDSLDTYFSSLVGSSLTDSPQLHDGPNGSLHPIYWWDLGRKTSGKIDLPNSDFWVGSVPGGFVYEALNQIDPDSSMYFRVRVRDGRTTRLGTPYPGKLRSVTVGPTGVVGYQDRRSTVYPAAFLPYGGKRSVKLDMPTKIPFEDFFRFTMSSRYLSFITRPGVHEGSAGYLVPLDGSKRIKIPHSMGFQIGRRILYGTDHATWRSPRGRISKTSVRGEVAGAAFGSAIIYNRSFTALRSLANARSAPKVLVHLHR